jgi:hypothetical protein
VRKGEAVAGRGNGPRLHAGRSGFGTKLRIAGRSGFGKKLCICGMALLLAADLRRGASGKTGKSKQKTKKTKKTKTTTKKKEQVSKFELRFPISVVFTLVRTKKEPFFCPSSQMVQGLGFRVRVYCLGLGLGLGFRV